MATALPPAAVIDAAVASSPRGSRSPHTTDAPSRASSCAISRPGPAAAPVTTATRSRTPAIVCLLSRFCPRRRRGMPRQYTAAPRLDRPASRAYAGLAHATVDTETGFDRRRRYGTDRGSRARRSADAAVLQDRRADVRASAHTGASDGLSTGDDGGPRRAARRHRAPRDHRRPPARADELPGGGALRRAVLNGHPSRRGRDGRDPPRDAGRDRILPRQRPLQRARAGRARVRRAHGARRPRDDRRLPDPAARALHRARGGGAGVHRRLSDLREQVLQGLPGGAAGILGGDLGLVDDLDPVGIAPHGVLLEPTEG